MGVGGAGDAGPARLLRTDTVPFTQSDDMPAPG
jgi:hypothetical protein